MHSENKWEDWDDLSTKASNNIKWIGGEEKLLIHFNKFGNFMNIHNVGLKTNFELISYSKYLIKSKKYNLEGEENPKKIENVKDCIIIYLEKKLGLSVRAINVLTSLERNYFFGINDENTINYFQKHFVKNFNFKNLNKIGLKTEIELNEFALELRSSFKDIISQNSGAPEILKPTLSTSINSLLEEAFPVSEILRLIEGEEYNFKELLCIYLINSKKHKNRNVIIENIYFNDREFNLTEISKKVELSRERVRQLHSKFSNELIPTAIEKVKEDIHFENYDMPIEDGQFYFDFEPFYPFEFNDKAYTPNISFSKLFYKSYYSDNYELLEDLINELIDEQRVFDFSKTIFLVSNELIDNTAFDKLLPFLEENIFEFESHAFDYNLEILIRRFYTENEIEIDQKYISEITRIIEKVKCLDIEVGVSTIKRIEKQKFKNLVIEVVNDLLNSTQKALRTEVLLLELERRDLEIERQKLLHLLGKNKSTFVRLGNGLWGLTNWEDSKEFQGSIREIVERALTKSEVPLHVSELIEMISQRRTIDESSLMSNLRATENNKFYFFNCAFIGLSAKKYDKFWYNIPRFNGNRFVDSTIRKIEKTTGKNILDYLHRKKGYPMIHLEYISEQRLKNQESENPEFDFE